MEFCPPGRCRQTKIKEAIKEKRGVDFHLNCFGGGWDYGLEESGDGGKKA
jgi:hypothetical protein